MSGSFGIIAAILTTVAVAAEAGDEIKNMLEDL